MEFPWRCNVDTIAMDLKVSWEMSALVISRTRWYVSHQPIGQALELQALELLKSQGFVCGHQRSVPVMARAIGEILKLAQVRDSDT